ncbi:protein cueball isoform X2 [Prorops nasuta]|uniref:protein cueball isoform X2 n=1 Tax=Prorops nasuta TaxID=863751 RepID=UPI0034CD79D0
MFRVSVSNNRDQAVVIGRDVNFFANKTLVGEAKIADAADLSSAAYDDTTHTMFLSDTKGNYSLFSNDLKQAEFQPKPILKRENGSYIFGIAFHVKSRTLFWTDAGLSAIVKMHIPLNGPPGEPKVLHDHLNPRGIALDVCNSHLYWTNVDGSNSSIERSSLDGTNRTTVLSKELYEPLGITIDHAEGRLYWTDDKEGIHYQIESSDLDGSSREIVHRGRRQQPVHLAVDRDNVYWTDFARVTVWYLPKHSNTSDDPVLFKNYDHTDFDPKGILTRDNSGNINCALIKPTRREKDVVKPATVVLPQSIQSYNNLTTSTEETDSTADIPPTCLNDGYFDKTSGSCKCKPGFSGAVCEVSLCYNHCLTGNCFINNFGLPECKCPKPFGGHRCEKDLCDGYCLNDGYCKVENGKPSCKCKMSTGPRCESLYDILEICAMYCASGQSVNLRTINVDTCSCEQSNHTAEEIKSYNEDFAYVALLPILISLVVMLILVIGVLSYYVNKLRRRPRIKKRFVVRKGGITPLTSRPQIPDNQCEITIENCCNMNICETPCFEPNLRTPTSRGNSLKKEEKNSLLDNMEGNLC